MTYTITIYKGDYAIIKIEPKEILCRCPKCGGTTLVKNGIRARNFTGTSNQMEEDGLPLRAP